MMLLILAFSTITVEKPVVRLEDSLIRGRVRQPNLVELSGQKLDEMIQQQALKNLIRLETELLKPSPTAGLKKQPSAGSQP